MVIQYKVCTLLGQKFIHQDFPIEQNEEKLSDNLHLMGKALTSCINAIKNHPEYNGSDFRVMVKNITKNKSLGSFDYYQVYSGD